MKENNVNVKEIDSYTVDLRHIFKSLWRRMWLIILSGIIAGGLGFCYPYFMIAPTYSSSVMLYVNNNSISLGNTSISISSSQISAAQSLVKTYGVILNNRTTLERVIQMTGVPYTYEQLSRMIVSAPSNDTEIMRITVTTTDPYEASEIANCIAEVLPMRISEIIDGASMEVVDSAIPVLSKVGPSITKYTALGIFLGVFACVAILVVLAILDDTIHDEEYILQTYDYPILAKIPDLLNSGSKKYGYSNSYSTYGNNSKKKEKNKKG